MGMSVMNRQLITFVLVAFAIIAAKAQDGLNVAELYDGRYRENPNAVETIISGDGLSQYDLDIYHGLSIRGLSADEQKKIERLVAKDGSSAVDKEVNYKGGYLYYGFYSLPPKNKKNCYLFYLNNNMKKGDKIIILYMEGRAGARKIKKMITK